MTKSNDDYKEFGAQYGDFPEIKTNEIENNNNASDLKTEQTNNFIGRQFFKDDDYAEFGAEYGTAPFDKGTEQEN